MAANPHQHASTVGGLLAPLAGWVLGPGAWAVHENLSYVLVQWACEAGQDWALDMASIALLLVAAAGGLVSWRSFNRLKLEDGADDRVRSRRFLALGGSGVGAISVLGILVETIPSYVLDPCLRAA